MNPEKPKNTFIERIKGLIDGSIEPENRNDKQVALAYEMYVKFHPEEKVDLEKEEDREKFMEFWSPLERKEDCFSVNYSKIENDPDFAEHSKFKGEINNITIDDVLYYKRHDCLPPDPERENEVNDVNLEAAE